MTIAIGVLASDGVVVAADTQETIGSYKSDESKLLIANQGGPKDKAGAIVVTGAGDGTYLDHISQETCENFLRKKSWTGFEWLSRFKTIIKKFNNESVVPFARFPDYDRPGFSLVAGAQIGSRLFLYSTDKGAVSTGKKYCAVGVGCAQARTMLRRFWTPMDTIRAASLAAYILFYVKNSVEGCGNETQIVIIKNGHAAYLSQSNINLLEYEFEIRGALENQLLHFSLGLDLPEDDIRFTLARFGSLLQKGRKNVLDAQKFEMWSSRAGKRPLDQPQMVRIPRTRRSSAQKLTDQQ